NTVLGLRQSTLVTVPVIVSGALGASKQRLGDAPAGTDNIKDEDRMATLDVVTQLKAARETGGMSLAELTELTGMDRSALSKLETGQRANPTVETLVRYAEAVGKRLVVSLTDA